METKRAHEEVYIAVNKKNGLMFGGKKNGTHIGYSTIRALKSAMTLNKLNHADYHFISLTFMPDRVEHVEGDEYTLHIVPKITVIEEKEDK